MNWPIQQLPELPPPWETVPKRVGGHQVIAQADEAHDLLAGRDEMHAAVLTHLRLTKRAVARWLLQKCWDSSAMAILMGKWWQTPGFWIFLGWPISKQSYEIWQPGGVTENQVLSPGCLFSDFRKLSCQDHIRLQPLLPASLSSGRFPTMVNLFLIVPRWCLLIIEKPWVFGCFWGTICDKTPICDWQPPPARLAQPHTSWAETVRQALRPNGDMRVRDVWKLLKVWYTPKLACSLEEKWFPMPYVHYFQLKLWYTPMIHVLCIPYFQTKPLLSGGSTVWLPACSALKELGPPVNAHRSPTCGFKKRKQHRGKCLLGTSDFQTGGIQREVSKMRLGNRNPLGIWIPIAPYRSLLGAEELHSHKGECSNHIMYHIPIISRLHPWCQYCKSAEFCTTTAPTCRYWIIAPWCRDAVSRRMRCQQSTTPQLEFFIGYTPRNGMNHQQILEVNADPTMGESKYEEFLVWPSWTWLPIFNMFHTSL